MRDTGFDDMSDDQKNLFTAMGLSLLVIIAWQYFYGVPQMEQGAQAATGPADSKRQFRRPSQERLHPLHQRAPRRRLRLPAASPAPPALHKPGDTNSAPQAPAPARRARTAAESSPTTQRVKIDSDHVLSGSINLTGGRIDDLSLKKYKETIKPDSDIVNLLSPPGSPNPFYTSKPVSWRRDADTEIAQARHKMDRGHKDTFTRQTRDPDLGQWRWPDLQARRSRSTTAICSM